MVDLAGSESVGKTGATGKVLEEAKSINKSLTVLSRVIESLGSGKLPPFRESQLTKLLKQSLGGNSKTTLLCTLSMTDGNCSESLSSLRFAKSVKKVKNNAKMEVQLSPQQMKILIEKLQAEISELKEKL